MGRRRASDPASPQGRVRIVLTIILVVLGSGLLIVLVGTVWTWRVEARLNKLGLTLSGVDSPVDERTRLLGEISSELGKRRPHFNFRR